MSNEVIIRPLKATDIEDIHALRVMPGVRENIMSTPFEELSDAERFFKSEGWYSLGAETKGHIAGVASLMRYPQERRSHCAGLGMMVRTDYQGRGLGRLLLGEVLESADMWLMLRRIELEVFTDNERAIRLYKSMGFVIEGTQRYAAVKEGKYCDMYMMARYHMT